MKKVRFVLLIHIIFFIGWAGIEEYRLYKPEIILLKTLPVDPRDLISGHYMTLNYALSNPVNIPGFKKEDMTNYSTDVFVYLEPVEKIVVNNVQRFIYLPSSVKYNCNFPANVNSDRGVWVKGYYLKNSGNIVYGIEKYYFSEKRKEKLNKLRSGDFYVEINVDKYGTMRVKDLIY
ncbi:GDYXXLXY domain-containing protein [Candidatus Dependentiae bacterium]|nr:GDYXXLXY domain-containing protein [Candidatus Dependentiae bacterium]